jgi:hypothetical protein
MLGDVVDDTLALEPPDFVVEEHNLDLEPASKILGRKTGIISGRIGAEKCHS